MDPDDISYVWLCDMRGKPFFRLNQNLVRGTADDVRRGMARKARARRVCRQARELLPESMDDGVTATLREQAEYYKAQTAKNEPPPSPNASIVAPIITPAVEAIAEAGPEIRREKTRAAARGMAGLAAHPLAGFTPAEMELLTAMDDRGAGGRFGLHRHAGADGRRAR